MVCEIFSEQMGSSWGFIEEVGWRKGPWTSDEDRLLIEYVKLHGEGRWNSVARLTGLRRNGKSCRLRWVNYLRPDLKRGQITPHEERIILELHARWGNRWSTIARSLPGRTDNEIKNYWRTHFKKKIKNSSDNVEKSRARLWKRQQFQQQQQQQINNQINNQIDIKKVMSLPTMPPAKQEMTILYPNNTIDQQDQVGFFYSSMLNNSTSISQSEPSSSNEDIMWDDLWNLDDFYGHFMINTTTYNKTNTTPCLQPMATTPAFY